MEETDKPFFLSTITLQGLLIYTDFSHTLTNDLYLTSFYLGKSLIILLNWEYILHTGILPKVGPPW